MPNERIAFAKDPYPNLDIDEMNDFLEGLRHSGASDLADAFFETYISAGAKASTGIFPANVTISGASDDLVDIEGAISEEFGAYNAGESTLTFDNGAVVVIRYGEKGIWRIRLIALGSAELVEHYQAPERDQDDYSDRLTLRGDFRVVRFAKGTK